MKLISSLLLFSALAQAQTFEIASLKRLPNMPAGTQGRIDLRGHRLYGTNITAAWLIRWAWHLPFWQLEGPSWIQWGPGEGVVRYGLQAVVAEDLPPAHAREALQALLASRMGLVYHWESRKEDAWVLSGQGQVQLDTEPRPDNQPPTKLADNVVTVTSMTMEQFCDGLSQSLKLPVIDKTGLGDRLWSAKFKVRSWEKDQLEDSMVTAIRRDLGFELHREKTGVQYFVVDKLNPEPRQVE